MNKETHHIGPGPTHCLVEEGRGWGGRATVGSRRGRKWTCTLTRIHLCTHFGDKLLPPQSGTGNPELRIQQNSKNTSKYSCSVPAKGWLHRIGLINVVLFASGVLKPKGRPNGGPKHGGLPVGRQCLYGPLQGRARQELLHEPRPLRHHRQRHTAGPALQRKGQQGSAPLPASPGRPPEVSQQPDVPPGGRGIRRGLFNKNG